MYNQYGHHPHGWCGLKFPTAVDMTAVSTSPPTRVVWIEISIIRTSHSRPWVTTHTGGVDWNFSCFNFALIADSHHPHGWCGLKFWVGARVLQTVFVTTHTGGVDWNYPTFKTLLLTLVTTHTGGVDWNIIQKYLISSLIVTTHTGGVDWNSPRWWMWWIWYSVTTHTGGVDWNNRSA